MSKPLALSLALAACAPKTMPSETPLADALNERKQAFAAKAPAETQRSYNDAVEALRATGILDRAKQVGEAAPTFTLPSALGEEVSLEALLAEGPVVLLWYRGGWCPYCNITLHAWSEQTDALDRLGATLVAISPETPDNSLTTVERNDLPFEVLSDVDNATARAYGTLFEVPDEVWSVYEDKLNIGAYYDHDRPELPLATTYVIAQDGTIAWAFLDADYRNRAEPRDVLRALKGLKKAQ